MSSADRSRMRSGYVRFVAVLWGGLLIAVSNGVHAQGQSSAKWSGYSCSVNSATLAFGTYDPLASLPDNNNASSLTVTCSGGSGKGTTSPVPTVALSAGSSGSFAQRTLKNGSNVLNYNVYTSSAYTTIWGDGTSSTVTQSASVTISGNQTSNTATSLTLFGQIPARQLNAAAGVYSDTLQITVDY